jgi:hypothetical protein
MTRAQSTWVVDVGLMASNDMSGIGRHVGGKEEVVMSECSGSLVVEVGLNSVMKVEQ